MKCSNPIQYFERNYNDIHPAAQFADARASTRGERLIYEKTSLARLCVKLGVVNPTPHAALADAWSTAQCYKRMISQPIH